jgi:hypothetical protein
MWYESDIHGRGLLLSRLVKLPSELLDRLRLARKTVTSGRRLAASNPDWLAPPRLGSAFALPLFHCRPMAAQ